MTLSTIIGKLIQDLGSTERVFGHRIPQSIELEPVSYDEGLPIKFIERKITSYYSHPGINQVYKVSVEALDKDSSKVRAVTSKYIKDYK